MFATVRSRVSSINSGYNTCNVNIQYDLCLNMGRIYQVFIKCKPSYTNLMSQKVKRCVDAFFFDP